MPINLDKPRRWKADIQASVALYNTWFLKFAPKTYRDERKKATEKVLWAFLKTANLTSITPALIQDWPDIVTPLRMCTCPPIARDRLSGLAGVSKTIIQALEANKLPKQISIRALKTNLRNICSTVNSMLDADLFPWLNDKKDVGKNQLEMSAMVVADRLCGANSDPIIRNAQEERQLGKIVAYLEAIGYRKNDQKGLSEIKAMTPATYAIHMNVVGISNSREVNIPVDIVVQPKGTKRKRLPILIEAKSAGDFTNVNKRRKEEAQKFSQLKTKYGSTVPYILFLCGYFDSGYLGYEAAEGIDWIWEHRLEDLGKLFK
jgi:hypothetical protein